MNSPIDYIMLVLAVVGAVAALAALLVQKTGYLAARYRTRVLTFAALVFCTVKASSFAVPEYARGQLDSFAAAVMLVGTTVSFWPVLRLLLRAGPAHPTTTALRS